MNPSYYRISLDIHEATSQLSFSIKKGDTNRRLLISLTDNGVPYEITGDCYAIFSARKADKQIVFNDCTIQKNMIIYDITEQTSLVEGRLDCEITLNGEYGQQITSPRFTIIVYASVYTEEEVESSSEYKSLATLVSEGNAVINEGKELIESLDGITDSTLSVENKAADAKAVGDALAEVEQNLSEKHDNLDERISANAEALGGKLDVPSSTKEGMVFYDPTTESTSSQGLYIGVPTKLSVPKSNSSGCIKTNTPIEDLDCANKVYVDDAVEERVEKIEKTSTTITVYTNDDAREHQLGDRESTMIPYSIPMVFGATAGKTGEPAGWLIGRTPNNPYHVANKKYVDDAVANAGGGLDVENVEITKGQIKVGEPYGEEEQPKPHALITDETVGLADYYGYNFAQLFLNGKNRFTDEEIGPMLTLGYLNLYGDKDPPLAYLKLPAKSGTLATLDDVGGGKTYYMHRLTVGFDVAPYNVTFSIVSSNSAPITNKDDLYAILKEDEHMYSGYPIFGVGGMDLYICSLFGGVIRSYDNGTTLWIALEERDDSGNFRVYSYEDVVTEL